MTANTYAPDAYSGTDEEDAATHRAVLSARTPTNTRTQAHLKRDTPRDKKYTYALHTHALHLHRADYQLQPTPIHYILRACNHNIQL